MKINIGSKNQIKIQAVKESISNYKFLSNAEILSSDTNSEVHKQPKSIDEILKGAMNRAKNAFKDCDYSFGIESGLMQVPNTKTGYMNVCACVIYDSRNYHIGFSSAFEHPVEVTKLLLSEGLEVNEAFHKVGLTENPKIGSAEGAVGILTKGRLMRKEYAKQAIAAALIHLENPDLY